MRLCRNYTPKIGSPAAVTSIQRIAFNTSCYNNCIEIFFDCKEKTFQIFIIIRNTWIFAADQTGLHSCCIDLQKGSYSRQPQPCCKTALRPATRYLPHQFPFHQSFP